MRKNKLIIIAAAALFSSVASAQSFSDVVSLRSDLNVVRADVGNLRGEMNNFTGNFNTLMSSAINNYHVTTFAPQVEGPGGLGQRLSLLESGFAGFISSSPLPTTAAPVVGDPLVTVTTPGAATPGSTPVTTPVATTTPGTTAPVGAVATTPSPTPDSTPAGGIAQATQAAIDNLNTRTTSNTSALGFLNTTNASNAARMDAIDQRVSMNYEHAKAGIASAVAMANMPNLSANKNFALAVGLGRYSNQSALSIGANARLTNSIVGRVSMSQDNFSRAFGAGASYEF